jgi:hypothetical protein
MQKEFERCMFMAAALLVWSLRYCTYLAKYALFLNLPLATRISVNLAIKSSTLVS